MKDPESAAARQAAALIGRNDANSKILEVGQLQTALRLSKRAQLLGGGATRSWLAILQQ